MGNRRVITVTMDGGVIQDITGIPEDVEVVVRDFDIEGCVLDDYLEAGELFKVDDNLCTQITWGPNEDEAAEATPATAEDIE